MTILKKKLRGSVLVFSLLVLAVLLSAALSAAAVVVNEKRSARSTQSSVVSFQIADSAIEIMFQRIYKNTDATLDTLAGNLPGSATCSGGVISGTLPGSEGSYEVTFLDNSGNELQCSGSGYSTYIQWRDQLINLLAVGEYEGTVRAVNAGVKPR